MIPCISQITTLPSDFAADVRGYAAVGCTAMEVWLTKLETFLESHSIDEVLGLVSECQMTLAAAAIQGGILLAQGDVRRESFARFEQRLELCRAMRISTLLVAPDFVDEVSLADYDRAITSLKQAAQRAREHGVRLALEFHGRAKFCNNMNTAASLVGHCDEPNVGVCLDVFHYYTGPSKTEDLGLLTADNLFHVQLSDLCGIPRELATDSDRVLPGDGDFHLTHIIDYLRAIGYGGYVSVELMNPRIWQMQPVQVAEVAITAIRRLLGLTGA
jgi:sugar phosphate isomerase/epimerase